MACDKCECNDCRRKSISHEQWTAWINSFPGDLSKYVTTSYGQEVKGEQLTLSVTFRKVR